MPSFVEQGYEEARACRDRLGLASSQPVDPFWVADQIGIIVALRPFEARRVSGLHICLSGVSLAVINSTDVIGRRRFTLAHEIAHSIFDKHEAIVDTLFDSREKDHREIRANCFAGELLLPIEAIRQWRPRAPWASSPNDIAELALHYGTSYEAALYRLKSAGLLSDGDIHELINRRAELTQETRAKLSERGEEEIVLPTRFLELAERAYSQGKISRGKYEELISGDIAK